MKPLAIVVIFSAFFCLTSSALKPKNEEISQDPAPLFLLPKLLALKKLAAAGLGLGFGGGFLAGRPFLRKPGLVGIQRPPIQTTRPVGPTLVLTGPPLVLTGQPAIQRLPQPLPVPQPPPTVLVPQPPREVLVPQPTRAVLVPQPPREVLVPRPPQTITVQRPPQRVLIPQPPQAVVLPAQPQTIPVQQRPPILPSVGAMQATGPMEQSLINALRGRNGVRAPPLLANALRGQRVPRLDFIEEDFLQDQSRLPKPRRVSFVNRNYLDDDYFDDWEVHLH